MGAKGRPTTVKPGDSKGKLSNASHHTTKPAPKPKGMMKGC